VYAPFLCFRSISDEKFALPTSPLHISKSVPGGSKSTMDLRTALVQLLGSNYAALSKSKLSYSSRNYAKNINFIPYSIHVSTGEANRKIGVGVPKMNLFNYH